jgi:hypothetical protein
MKNESEAMKPQPEVSSPAGQHSMPDKNHAAGEIKREKIHRAMLAGPSSITSEATVAGLDRQGNLTVVQLALCTPRLRVLFTLGN